LKNALPRIGWLETFRGTNRASFLQEVQTSLAGIELEPLGPSLAGNPFDSVGIHLLDFYLFRALQQGNWNVNNLKIPLTRITELGFLLETEADVKQLQPQDAEGLPLERVGVHGLIQPVGGAFLFQGRIEGTFLHPCDRCLEEAKVPFKINVVWTFREGPAAPGMKYAGGEDPFEFEDEESLADDTGDFFLFEGDEIDFAPHVWEEAVLAAPVKYICRPDCRGLCPRCGVNRNLERCGCPENEESKFGTNQGLAGLANLFPDLAPKCTKE
jgi:uncharacterized metal-binding protein YceD (DUF177 family)